MKNNKNSLLITVVAVVVVGLVGFFGGMQYQKSRMGSFSKGEFQGGPNGQAGAQKGQTNRQGIQPISGEITAQDEKSLTVKSQDGSSKIIIFSETTKVNKTSEGSKDDLEIGEQVTVIGTSNSDGSLTAQTISIGNNFLRNPNQENQPGQGLTETAN